MRRKKAVKLEWEEAPEVKEKIDRILSVLDMEHVKGDKIFCYRTQGSSSRSYARIWSFPKIFQQALGIDACYVIEVLSKYFDPLREDDQIKVLIHELLHIPKNFSGALLPHRNSSGRHLEHMANQLFRQYKQRML